MSLNNLKITNWIAKKILAQLTVNLPYVHAGNTNYLIDFDNGTYAKGDTIQIRRANRRTGGEGQTVSYEGVNDRTENMTIEKQFNDAFQFTSKEQTLFTTGKLGSQIYYDRYIAPAVNRLSTQIDQYFAKKAAMDLVYYYGTPGTPINSWAVLSSLRAKMQDLSMPVYDNRGEEPYLIVTPQDGGALKSEMRNYFNPTFNKEIGEKFFLDEVAGFMFQTTQVVYRHIPGAASTMVGLTIKTTVSSGNQFTITGATPSITGAIKAGDIIEVDGSYIIAPQTFNKLPYKACFVAVSDADSDISGDILVTVKDEIIVLGTNSNANISDPLLATSPVTVKAAAIGSIDGGYNVNTAFCKEAFTYAMPKMQTLDTPVCTTMSDTVNKTGIVIRIARFADGQNDQNLMRLDVLVGGKWFPEFGIKVLT